MTDDRPPRAAPAPRDGASFGPGELPPAAAHPLGHAPPDGGRLSPPHLAEPAAGDPFRVGDRLRVGLFTHSVNPRGGVVHCLELGRALVARGHAVTVHAPAEPGDRFFRAPRGVALRLIPAAPAPAAGGLSALVRQRGAEYANFLRDAGTTFDVWHAHDGLSGGALATLAAEGAIPGFVRTVHHLDDFADPYLRDTQDRSVTAAAAVLCVSRLWRAAIRDRYGIDAAVVPNGVDTDRFTPRPSLDDHRLRDRLMGVGGRAPMYLAVGGVERRKNAIGILRAFLQVLQELPRALLVVAGGASLLDHSGYRREFDAELAAAGPAAAGSVVITGPLPDHQMAAAYRLADALVFPSTTEGFGLAVLEALACGTPAVVSRVPPFTEYLTDADALLVDPHDPAAIAAAMRQAAEPERRARLRDAGQAVAARFTWAAAAAAHERTYFRVAPPPAVAAPAAEPAGPAAADGTGVLIPPPPAAAPLPTGVPTHA